MTSEGHAYVWTWLPGASEPVVAGVLQQQDGELWFTYGRSYLQLADAVPLQPAVRLGNWPGLPLREGPQRPPLPPAHGVIRDSAPGLVGHAGDPAQAGRNRRRRTLDELSLLTYLLESGSNRIGGLDFQTSHDGYTPRSSTAPLEELLEAAARIEQGEAILPRAGRRAGARDGRRGARPKALLRDEYGTEMIAKFSVSTDVFPWMQAEAVGMELARRCGVTDRALAARAGRRA
jgi:serine/threonine-protein kinase HipA